MKKFLTLALVLGMVGLTSASIAGIQIRSDKAELKPSEMATITIFSDTPLLGGWGGMAAIIIGGPGQWTGQYTLSPTAPQSSSFEVSYLGDQRPDFPFDAWYADLSSPSVTPVPAMDYISFGFHCTGEGTVQIVVTDYDGVVQDSVSIIQTPEPVTMLLLGLGGLFIRKR